MARDEKRPFVVEVNGRPPEHCRRRGSGSASWTPDPVDVLVNQGEVDVSAAALTRLANPVALRGQYAADPVQWSRTRRSGSRRSTVTRELAWREGKLAFEGETLKQAADTFARYSQTRIVRSTTRALAREPVTGLFAANDPVGFSRAIARVFDARLEQQGDSVVLTRAAARGSGVQ